MRNPWKEAYEKSRRSRVYTRKSGEKISYEEAVAESAALHARIREIGREMKNYHDDQREADIYQEVNQLMIDCQHIDRQLGDYD